MTMATWQPIIIGLRKKLNISQNELANLIGIERQNISRYELGDRNPSNNNRNRFIEFIKNNNLSHKELEKIGSNFLPQIKMRFKTVKFDLEYSEDLAEFIGILLGDGEIKNDGEIRISFNPYNEKEYIYQRIIPLIKKFFDKEVSFESEKRIRFQSKSIRLFLETKCNIKAGEKYSNQPEVPLWCFTDKKFLTGILRGLFDTDGYIGYSVKHCVEIMFGRFSSRAEKLTRSISDAISYLGIENKMSKCKDEKFRVRINNAINVKKFFNLIGSSNLKNIIKFLLWRLTDYEVKINTENFSDVIEIFEEMTKFNIKDIDIPFYWSLDKNRNFTNFISKDQFLIKSSELRNYYNWSLLIRNLNQRLSEEQIAEFLGVSRRTVNCWEWKTRNPEYKFVFPLLYLGEINKLAVNDYRVVK